MNKQKLISQIRQGKNITKFVDKAIKNPEFIKDFISIIENENSSVKFGCEKIVRLISEKRPKLVYPYFDFFVKLLDSENSFLKWGGIITISNLVKVDSKNKFEKIFKKYYAPVLGPNMITAGNIVGNSWKIVKAKPKLADKIVNEMLKIERATYKHKGKLSPECKKVICGNAIDSFEKLFDKTTKKQKIINFVKRQLKSTRPSAIKRAEKFLKKFG